MVNTTGSTKLVETSEVYKKRYEEKARLFSASDILRLIKIAGDAEQAVRWNGQPRLRLETGLMQMIRMDESVQIDLLLQQIEEIKKKLQSNGTDQLQSLEPANLETSTPIRGSVKATQPALRADQIVAARLPAAEQWGSLKSSGAPLLSPPQSTTTAGAFHLQPTVSLSFDDAIRKWAAFVEEARKSKIALGTMLSGTHVIDVQQDRLRIGCPDDFHLDLMQRNRQFLHEIAQKVYGAKILLETMLIKDQHPVHRPPQKPSPPGQPADLTQAKDGISRHPVVQALIKEFGAVEAE